MDAYTPRTLAEPTDDIVNGWSYEGAWYGDEFGGDAAITPSATGIYTRPDPDGEPLTECLDLGYYVYGDDENGYGVELCTHVYYRDHSGDTVDDARESYDYDHGSPLNYETAEKALEVALRLGAEDERWKFA